MVVLVFCSGILSKAASWQHVAPDHATFVPIEWRHTGTEESVVGGESGDFIEVTALRMLAAVLKNATGGQPWAIAGHSAGGAVMHACMDRFCALLTDQSTALPAIVAASQRLPAAEAEELQASLAALGRDPLGPPVAAVSFEGSLLPCDVEGWAEDWAKRDEPPLTGKPEDEESCWIRGALNDPKSTWTWPMAKACCASLWARCMSEPPRHLTSIRKWMELPQRPSFFYIGGKDSGHHIEEHVFASLRSISEEIGMSSLKLGHIDKSGHNLHREAPDEVKAFLASSLHLETHKRKHHESA